MKKFKWAHLILNANGDAIGHGNGSVEVNLDLNDPQVREAFEKALVVQEVQKGRQDAAKIVMVNVREV